MIFSEAELGLKPPWFTGKQWADGTAERELRREYLAAVAEREKIERSKTPAQKARDHAARQQKRFNNWFEYSLRKDEQER